jgi:hypothetical protein
MKKILSCGFIIAATLAGMVSVPAQPIKPIRPIKGTGNKQYKASLSSSPIPAWTFTGRKGKTYFQLTTPIMFGLSQEESILKRMAGTTIRLLALHIINKDLTAFSWQNDHDQVKVTLKNGKILTSENISLFFEGKEPPWGYTYVMNLVAPATTVPASEKRTRMVGFRNAFAYEDISEVTLKLGVTSLPMKQIATPRH